MSNIVGHIRRAVQDYGMIRAGDRIAVGVSGGKDSGALLFALEKLSHFYPEPFELTAIIVDMGIGMDYTPLEERIRELGIPCIRKQTDIAKLIFEVRKESNPCALCAVMRRGALNRAAAEAGCNKVALGHHYDDVLETFLLNLIHGGRLGCFQPVTYLDRMELTVIRPMIYVEEKRAASFCRDCRIPVIENPCPANGETQRQEMKELMRELNRRYPGLRKRVFGALQRSGLDEW